MLFVKKCCEIATIPFPTQSDLDPVTLLIRLLLHLGREGDSAHDPVTELLIDDCLEGVSVVLDDLEETVDEGLLWWKI